MATQYSLQAAKAYIQNPYTYRKENLAIDFQGRRRVAAATFITASTAPAAGSTNSGTPPIGGTTYDGGYGPLNSGDVLYLFDIPQGARILGGIIATDGLGSSVTGSIGTVANSYVDFLNAASLASAGQVTFGNTIALGFCSVPSTTAITPVYLLIGGANTSTGKNIAVAVDYVID